jgi:hypothetical protein
MYRPEHDLGLQRSQAKEKAKEQQNLNDGLPA